MEMGFVQAQKISSMLLTYRRKREKVSGEIRFVFFHLRLCVYQDLPTVSLNKLKYEKVFNINLFKKPTKQAPNKPQTKT